MRLHEFYCYRACVSGYCTSGNLNSRFSDFVSKRNLDQFLRFLCDFSQNLQLKDTSEGDIICSISSKL